MPTDPEELRTDTEEHDDEGGPVKSFLEHLEDLRWVLIKSGAAIAVGMLLCLIAGDRVMTVLKWPLTRAKISYPGTNQVWHVMFGTNRVWEFKLDAAQHREMAIGTNRELTVRLAPVPVGTNLALGLVPDLEARPQPTLAGRLDLTNLGPVGGFFVALQIALYGGLVLAAPFVFYFVAAFIFPALRMREKYFVYRGLGFGLGLFLTGITFCYFVLMPLALNASVAYSNWLGIAVTQWRAEEYISFVCKFMLGMGLGFQMPVVLLTLVRMGVLSYSSLSKMRRYMIVVNLILGALLTTPEVVTQVLMAIPLQILYEISVWIAWYWERRDRKRDEASQPRPRGRRRTQHKDRSPKAEQRHETENVTHDG